MQNENKMVKENLGLVHSCAKRFLNRNIDYDDIFQTGCIGLIKAARSFDESKGFKFSTYAVPVILGEIKQMFRNSSSIKISRKTKELSIKIKKESEKFFQKNERQPTINELCKKLKTGSEKILEALEASAAPISLTFCGEETTQKDIPIEFGEESISERILLTQALKALTQEERAIISLRYFKGLTQEKTAKVLSLSQAQVSRQEKKIIKALQRTIN